MATKKAKKAKELTTPEKVEAFKKRTQQAGFNTRNGMAELADLLYGEIERVEKSIPTAKKSK